MGDIVMGQLGKGLDALLSKGIEKHSIAGKNQSEVKQKAVVEPENLSAMDLVYAVYAEDGEPLVGSPTAGFAYFDESTDTLVVVNADAKKVMHLSLDSIMASVDSTFLHPTHRHEADDSGVLYIGRLA